MSKCRPKHHEEQNEGRAEINVKSNHDDVHRAMDQTVSNTKEEVNPGAHDVDRIDIFRHEEVKNEGVEHHGNFEEIFQVVRGTDNVRWCYASQIFRFAKLSWIDTSADNKMNSSNVHVNPNDEGQSKHREERPENRLLS